MSNYVEFGNKIAFHPGYYIKEYIEAGTTAICPNCRVSAIIPDSVDEDINLEVINNMNEYWY